MEEGEPFVELGAQWLHGTRRNSAYDVAVRLGLLRPSLPTATRFRSRRAARAATAAQAAGPARDGAADAVAKPPDPDWWGRYDCQWKDTPFLRPGGVQVDPARVKQERLKFWNAVEEVGDLYDAPWAAAMRRGAAGDAAGRPDGGFGPALTASLGGGDTPVTVALRQGLCAVEGCGALDWLSSRWYGEHEDEESNSVPPTGFAAVLRGLAGAEVWDGVRLGRAVSSVRWCERHGVTVSLEGGDEVRGKIAVVTVSAGVLKRSVADEAAGRGGGGDAARPGPAGGGAGAEAHAAGAAAALSGGEDGAARPAGAGGWRNPLRFEPPLPEWKRAAVRASALGQVEKLVVRWDRRWWPREWRGLAICWPDGDHANDVGALRGGLGHELSGGCAGAAAVPDADVVASGAAARGVRAWTDDGAAAARDGHPGIAAAWDRPRETAARETAVPAWCRGVNRLLEVPTADNLLVAFLTGPSARAAAGLGPAELSAGLRALLDRFLPPGASVPPPRSVVCTRWTASELTLGSYSYVPAELREVGGVPPASALGAPVLTEGSAARLLFAGEACSEGSYGTVNGAIDEGRRAARQALMALARA